MGLRIVPIVWFAAALSLSCSGSPSSSQSSNPPPQPDPCVANGDTLSGFEDVPVVLDGANIDALLLTNDVPAADTTLSVAAVGTAVHGIVELVGGTVTFTPEPDYSGQASFVYQASDGEVTCEATVTVTLAPVNDAPTFVASADPIVSENAGPQSLAGWATAISAGPSDETAQTLAFDIVANTDPSLFATAPTVSATGALSFTPAPFAYGTATLTLTLRDDGGTADGGVDTSAPVAFDITVERNEISTFVFRAADNPSLPVDAVGTITGTSIAVAVPWDTDLRNLVPTVTTTGGSVDPPSGTTADFWTPAVYQATLASGTNAYVVSVTLEPAPVGSPIVATASTWTWVDFPNSYCDDGTPTGIGINPSDTSSNVLVFLNGGGACWDYTTCGANISTHGPYGATQFAADLASISAGSIFDRTEPRNPFADWSFVFVPYCTSDVHAGDNVAIYTVTVGGFVVDSKTYYHEGRVNVAAFLERLGATFTDPAKVVISGSSAGGGGVVMSYNAARAYWPGAAMYLIDDSLPLFVGTDIPASERTAWSASWDLPPYVDPMAGVGWGDDYSRMYTALAERYPADRMALLSSLQDQVIRAYYLGMSGAAYEASLGRLDGGVLAPSDIRRFFVAGTTHTMLGSPGSFATAGGVDLWTWLGQMVGDDAAWASTGP